MAVVHDLADVAQDAGWGWLAESGMASFAAFRLQLGQTVLGIFGVFSRGTISADFVRQLHLSTNQLAVALEKGRLLKAMRGRAEELTAAYDELQKLDAMKDWFISAISHELRTPLTSIRSFSEILERYEDLTGEERLEFAGIIREESERLTLMIDDVLDLSRIVHGQLELTPMPFDLVPMIARACKLFSRQAAERRMELRQELPDQAWVSADESAIARVLNNLLGNAFKFTPDGGGIELSVRSVAGEVEVSVRDSGRRHSARRPGAHLRALHPARQPADRQARRQRHRPGHLQGAGGGVRRQHLGGEPARRGRHVPVHPPRRGRETAEGRRFGRHLSLSLTLALPFAVDLEPDEETLRPSQKE